MNEKGKKGFSQSKFESFFKLRKKTAKPDKVIKSKKDKGKEKRVRHRELIKESEDK
ncbi:MAG: hypothetical protein HYW01_13190 [Deltaproteobacteria bacterium]|nr:hypothetical protein [Deltaproteobacteria bacterium]